MTTVLTAVVTAVVTVVVMAVLMVVVMAGFPGRGADRAEAGQAPSRRTSETSSRWDSVSLGSAQCTVRPSTVIA